MSLEATDSMRTGGCTDERPLLPPPVPRPASGIEQEQRTGCGGGGDDASVFFFVMMQWASMAFFRFRVV